MNTRDGGLYFEAGIDTAQLRRDIAGVRGQFATLASDVESEGRRMDATFRTLGAGFGAFFAVGQIQQFMSRVIATRSEIQALGKSLDTLTGSAEVGAKLLAEMKQFAATTPMQLNDLAKGAQTLLGFNIEAERVMPTLRAIGDISMGDAQKFQSLTLAFSQMSATGKLMGQDLLQMINAGFNPLVQISEATGKSISTLKDEMSAGKVSVEMVTEAFMSATAEGGKFHGMLAGQGNSMKGSLAQLQGAVADMYNEIGQATEGIVAGAVSVAHSLVEHYDEVGVVLTSLIATYGLYKASLMATIAIENAHYTQEAQALASLLPAKEADSNADIRAAVAKGQLSEATAQKVIALRAEVAAYRDSLVATQAAALAAKEEAAAELAAAEAAMASATKRAASAELNVEMWNREMMAAQAACLAEEEARAVKELGIAVDEQQTAAKQRNIAAKRLEAAQTQATATAEAAATATKQLDTLTTGANTVGKQLNTRATLSLASAQAVLSKAAKATGLTMLANPYVAVGAAVAALTYVIYKLVTAEDAAAAATKAMNSAMDAQKQRIDSFKQSVHDLLNTINDPNATGMQKVLAFEELKKIAPTLTETANTWQQLAGTDTANLEKGLNALADQKAETQLQSNVATLKDLTSQLASFKQQGGETGKTWGGLLGAITGAFAEIGGETIGKDSLMRDALEKAGFDKEVWSYYRTDAENLRAVNELIRQHEAELGKMAEAKREAATPMEVKMSIAEQDYNLAKEKLDYFNRFADAMAAKMGKMSPAHILNPAQADADMDEIESTVDKKIADLRKTLSQPLSVEARANTEKAISELEDLKDEMGRMRTEATDPLKFDADSSRINQKLSKMGDDIAGFKADGLNSGLFTVEMQLNWKVESLQQALAKAEGKWQNYVTPDGQNPAVTRDKEWWTKQRDEAQSALDKMGSEKIGSAEWKAQERTRDEAAKMLEKWSGKSGNRAASAAAKAATEAKQQAEAQRKLAEEAEAMERDTAAAQLALMEEGRVKKLAQMEREYADRIAELDRQKADWARENKEAGTKGLNADGLTTKQASALDGAMSAATAAYRKQLDDLAREDDAAMDEYLMKYGSLEEKKLAIARVYARKRATATSNGERAALFQEEMEAVAGVDFDDFLRNRASAAFGEADNLTHDTITRLIEELEKYRDKVTQTFDPEKIQRFNQALANLRKAEAASGRGFMAQMFTPEVFRQIQDAQAQLRSAQQEQNRLVEEEKKKRNELKKIISDIAAETGLQQKDITAGDALQTAIDQLREEGRTTEADNLQTMADDMSKTATQANKLGDAVAQGAEGLKQMQGALDNMQGGFGGAMNVVGAVVHGINDAVQGAREIVYELADTAEAFGGDTSVGSNWDKAKDVMDGFAQASQGATDAFESLKSGNVMGVVSGVVKSFTSWFKLGATLHDKKKERLILGYEEDIEELERYNKRIEHALKGKFSFDLSRDYERLAAITEQQISLINEQIAAEEDKKNSDKERIREWEDEAEELAWKAEEYRQQALDAVFGEEIGTAIDRFADALAKGWENASDAAEAAKDVAVTMLRTMVNEAIKSDLTAPVTRLREEMRSVMADNFVTPMEEAAIKKHVNDIISDAREKYEWASHLFEDDTQEQSGARGTSISASQDSVDELTGRATAIQICAEARRQLLEAMNIDMAAIRAELTAAGRVNEEMRSIAMLSLGHLEDISRNTRQLFAINDRLASIERNTRMI